MNTEMKHTKQLQIFRKYKDQVTKICLQKQKNSLQMPPPNKKTQVFATLARGTQTKGLTTSLKLHTLQRHTFLIRITAPTLQKQAQEQNMVTHAVRSVS